MSNDINEVLLRRLDRLEAIISSTPHQPDLSPVIADLRKTVDGMAARLASAEIAASRAAEASKVVARHEVDSRFKSFMPSIGEAMAISAVEVSDDLQQRIDDATRAVIREATAAKSTAEASAIAAADFLKSIAFRYGA